MGEHLPDSLLNKAERALQQPFRKPLIFNAFVVFTTVLSVYGALRGLPDRRPLPDANLPIDLRSVPLPPPDLPLRLAGAWEARAGDPRFGGLSSLVIDQDRFLAVSDQGAVVRFDRPGAARPSVSLADLGVGPGPFGKKWSRDAESLVRDPGGRGWWVGYEQRHSLWLYDPRFDRALAAVDLRQPRWGDNRGAEGLLAESASLLVTAENGRDAISVRSVGIDRTRLKAGADVADAARAPDGSAWLLLRSKGLGGISQSIAPLIRDGAGYRAGPSMPLPKAAFDNYEGMAIEPGPDGGWRFWLVTDDGHRILARTLLVALDLPGRPDMQRARRPAPSLLKHRESKNP